MTALLVSKKINHVAIVIDESGSMAGKERDVVTVVDQQVAWLAKLSQDMDQETRVSIYKFEQHTIECIAFDIDVLRMPSLRGHYKTKGGTPLISATLKAISDLKQTCQLYGDHGFLVFVLTDGEENTSHYPQTRPYGTPQLLQNELRGLPENWTVGVLVPDFRGKMSAQSYGFSAGNIAIWDTTGKTGVSDAGEEIKAATSSYFTQRAAGVRGTNTLFAQNVSAAQVASSGMTPVSSDSFMIVPVALASTSSLAYVIPNKSKTKKNPDGIKHVEIMPFIEETGRKYVAGTTFYELVKSEKFDPHKQVVLIHRQTKQVYKGDQCKKLLGLGSTSTRVRPQPVKGGDYDVFIQSTSVNRHLPIGSRVLIFK